ncbi:NAD(P)/FAD-dependent oxidoreductase [Aquitalea magnusonii]|uniref:Glycine/D-amino acid oxidase-like deaminating enzyme n=1 Tax=Aquitalea magnusonii TaxID=332411 RepID=A0A318JML4_9NEIS|nr:FAD-binding oxidoreductase [Aquitalea magnusonii]PXX48816.1 glycine/D-amino acid oxidase-like deaminating enzyme [Aquitalea magnusonii]
MFESSAHYPPSWYAASSQAEQVDRPPLCQDLDVDVLVVGAGYTGLYTAHNLADAGVNVAVIEASRVGWAASGRNGGQLILGFSCDMPPIEAALGLETAREIWQLLRGAAADIRHKISHHHIDCELAEGHLWTSVLWQRIRLLSEWQEHAARHYDYQALQFVPRKDLPQHVGSERYVAGLIDREGGHFHPLKYILGLARAAEEKGVAIFEQTRALSYTSRANGCEVQTAQGKIRCRKLVLATNAYIDQLDPALERRIMPVGTYMIATEPLPEEVTRQLLPSNMAVSDNQFILDYFRLTADRSLLFGGKCTYSGRTPANLTASMRADLLRVFPQLAPYRITHTWGGHIDITVPRTPDFGCRGDVYWAQGFSGHGVVPTCAAGRVLADAILGDSHLLQQFMRLSNPDFPGGKLLRVPLQAAGMFYYRLRDYAIPGLSY